MVVWRNQAYTHCIGSVSAMWSTTRSSRENCQDLKESGSAVQMETPSLEGCRAGNKDSPAQCPAFTHAARTNLPVMVDVRLSDRSWTMTSVVWSRLRPTSVLVGPLLDEDCGCQLWQAREAVPVSWLRTLHST